MFWIFGKLLLKLLFCLKKTGVENVPRTGKLLIASNHRSYLDPVLIGVAAPRRLHYMARDNLFRVPILGEVIKAVGAFPVRRKGINVQTVKTSLEILEKGGAVVIFPEGTRGNSDKLGKGHKGVGMLAALAKADVVPAFITGSDKALPQGAKWIRFAPITVSFGKRIAVSELIARGEDTHNSYQRICDEVMEQIDALRRESRS